MVDGTCGSLSLWACLAEGRGSREETPMVTKVGFLCFQGKGHSVKVKLTSQTQTNGAMSPPPQTGVWGFMSAGVENHRKKRLLALMRKRFFLPTTESLYKKKKNNIWLFRVCFHFCFCFPLLWWTTQKSIWECDFGTHMKLSIHQRTFKHTILYHSPGLPIHPSNRFIPPFICSPGSQTPFIPCLYFLLHTPVECFYLALKTFSFRLLL